MVLALSVAYVHFDGLPWMQRVFYGVGAAVIAIIARSAIKLVRMTLGRDRLLWMLFTVSAVVTAWTGTEIIWVFFLCGLVPVLIRTVPKASTVASVAPIGFIFSYFAGAGLFVFGSGLAIVPFLHGGVVQTFHWITERQFLDAVAVSLITPGPVVITVAFIGYLVAGLPGACAAAAGVFLPVYLVTLLLAPSFHRWAEHVRIKAFVDGVTAAATGAIAGAVVVLGRRALGDAGAVLIAIATFALLVGVKRVPEPVLILAAGAAGLVLQ
jgi:chromate transporter